VGGKCDNNECNLNKEHPFPRVAGYKRRGDIKEVEIAEFRVYYDQYSVPTVVDTMRGGLV
jgi:hypothetical protein